jgi:hypothetical protein
MPLAPFKEMGSVGLNRDVYAPDTQPSEWTAGRNLRFRDGYAEKMQGHAAIYGAPQVPPYAVFPTNGVAGRYWVYCGLQKVYAVQNTTHTDITRQTSGADVLYTGTAANKWNGGVLTGVLFLNNGVDVPQFWGGDPAVKMANLTGWPAGYTCKVLRPFRNFLMALNVSNGAANFPTMVKWSTEADPGTLPATWDVTDATHDAGQVDLADTPDVIVDGLSLGQNFVVYKEGSTWLAQYSGQPYIFNFAPLSKQAGALAQNCAVEFPGGHAVLTQGDIVVVDFAGNVTSIADARIRKYLFNSIDSTNYGNSFAVANLRRNEIWFCVPKIGATWPNMAMVWNWKSNTWGTRDLPNVSHANSGVIVYAQGNSWQVQTTPWNLETKAWGQNEYTQATPRLVLASANDNLIYLADVGETFGAAAMTANCEKTGITFDAPERLKLITEVRPIIDAPAGTVVNVYVGGQADAEAPITWTGPFPFTVGTSLKVDTTSAPCARYVGVKFETTAICTWRVKQFTVNAQMMGLY